MCLWRLYSINTIQRNSWFEKFTFSWHLEILCLETKVSNSEILKKETKFISKVSLAPAQIWKQCRQTGLCSQAANGKASHRYFERLRIRVQPEKQLNLLVFMQSPKGWCHQWSRNRNGGWKSEVVWRGQERGFKLRPWLNQIICMVWHKVF